MIPEIDTGGDATPAESRLRDLASGQPDVELFGLSHLSLDRNCPPALERIVSSNPPAGRRKEYAASHEPTVRVLTAER